MWRANLALNPNTGTRKANAEVGLGGFDCRPRCDAFSGHRPTSAGPCAPRPYILPPDSIGRGTFQPRACFRTPTPGTDGFFCPSDTEVGGAENLRPKMLLRREP